MKCPECNGKTKLVWRSPDGRTAAYRCVSGHRVGREIKHPVYLVEE